jgi:hypothetical protein
MMGNPILRPFAGIGTHCPKVKFFDKLEMVKPPDSSLRKSAPPFTPTGSLPVIEELGRSRTPPDYIQMDILNETKYDLYCNVLDAVNTYWEIKPLFPVLKRG